MAKRILIYTNHFYPEQFKINEIVEWLSEEKFTIRVITGIPNYPSGKFYSGYNFFRSPKSKYSSNVIINRLFLIPRGNGLKIMLILNYLSYFFSCLLYTFFIMLFKKKYDYIFVHHTSPFLIAINPIIYGIFHRKAKKILWDLDIWPETLEAVNILSSKIIMDMLKKFVKFIYSFYDEILVSSYPIKNIIKTRYNRKITYFPNWAEKIIESNLQQYNFSNIFPKNKLIIMYTGNIGTSQNFDLLSEVIKDLKNKNIFWVFIGDGRYKKSFITKLGNNLIKKSCLFINQVEVEKIPSYIKYSDITYLSLDNKSIFQYTIPAKLQSYMAMGKPILASISGEGARLINESKSGFVINDKNKNEFIALLEQIQKLSKKELKNLGLNSLNYYKEHFTSNIRKKQLIKILS